MTTRSQCHAHAARLAVALVALALLTGCTSKPSARMAGLSLQGIDLASATLLVDVEVTNPYALPLPLTNLDYSLASGAKAFLAGKADLEGTVPAMGLRTVSLPLTITYDRLLTALSGVRPGQVVPYDAALGLSVDVPVAGALRLPLEKSGQLPVPAAPQVTLRDIAWTDLSLDKAAGVVRLAMTNRNQFPLDLSKIDYALSLGGTEVARSSLAKAVSFAADGGSGELEIPISFSPKSLGLGVWRMLTGSSSGYDLSGAMAVDTPFGKMSLPVTSSGKAPFSR